MDSPSDAHRTADSSPPPSGPQTGEASRSAADPDSEQQRRRTRRLLIVLSCVHGLLLLATPGFLLVGAFASDSRLQQKSAIETAVLRVMVTAVVSVPASSALALLTSWIAFRVNRLRTAGTLIWLPVLNAIVFAGAVITGLVHYHTTH